jgi:hypothetical protein
VANKENYSEKWGKKISIAKANSYKKKIIKML